MGIGYVLYNSKAGMNNKLENVKKIEKALSAELKFIDILEIIIISFVI